MFDIQNEVLEWGGKKLTIETGRVARQAHGSVIATYGGTSVLATVVSDRDEKKDIDFFPLTVNYQEKAYAAGKIPGGFFKREGRPSEKETLVSRLIDRPIRPLFADGFKCETQVIATVISYDTENDPDIVAMIACSAALTLSGVPFMGPIGAARVGFKDGEYILNPTNEEMETSDLDLVVAGTKDAVLMVESEAKELSEEQMLGAVTFGQENFSQVIDSIINLAEKAAKELKERVVNQVGMKAHSMFVGTFHSFCFQITKKFSSDTSPSLIDKSEAIHMLLDRYDEFNPLESEEFSLNPKTAVTDSFIPFFNISILLLN